MHDTMLRGCSPSHARVLESVGPSKENGANFDLWEISA